MGAHAQGDLIQKRATRPFNACLATERLTKVRKRGGNAQGDLNQKELQLTQKKLPALKMPTGLLSKTPNKATEQERPRTRRLLS